LNLGQNNIFATKLQKYYSPGYTNHFCSVMVF